MTATESNFFWRAVAVNLLREWADEPTVRDALVKSARDTNELVRAGDARGSSCMRRMPARRPVAR